MVKLFEAVHIMAGSVPVAAYLQYSSIPSHNAKCKCIQVYQWASIQRCGLGLISVQQFIANVVQ